MTRDEAVNLILRRCQRPAGESRLVADVVAELASAQIAAENDPFKPWFLLKGVDTALDANGYYINLPSDFLVEDDNTNAVMLLDTTVTPNQLHKLEKAEYAEVARGLKPVDRPAYWAISGGKLFLSRAFEDHSIRLIYKARQAVNETAYGSGGQPDPNYWLQYAPEYLVNLTGEKLALFYLSDEKKAAAFAAGVEKERTRLVLEDAARTEAARARFMGSDEYEMGTGLGADGALPAPPLTQS